jgi:outer membrane immunogenic protein
MRKLLLAGTAVAVVMAAGSAGAADLSRPVYKAPPPIPVFSWTGWYVGVHVGGAWGTKEWSDPTVFDGFTTFNFPDTTINNYGVNGFLGGVQIGYNYQSGPWVWGVEAQASWAGIRGSDSCPFFIGKSTTCKTNVDALGSFAVRFGGTIDRAMLYVKGGLAWAYERHRISSPNFISFDGIGAGAFSIEQKHWRWGGMLGAGVEFAFTNSISGKLEYNYMDFGTRTYSFAFPGVFPFVTPEDVDVKIRQSIHLVKVGLNYRFDVGKYPVSARY